MDYATKKLIIAARMKERKRCANLVLSLDGIIYEEQDRKLVAAWILRSPYAHQKGKKRNAK